MKKSLLFVSMIAALCITGCNNSGSNTPSPSASSDVSTSEQSSNSTSSEAPKEEIKNDNFTLLNPNDLSSMSPNCKKYVDDMRNQQKKLIAEKGETFYFKADKKHSIENVTDKKATVLWISCPPNF